MNAPTISERIRAAVARAQLAEDETHKVYWNDEGREGILRRIIEHAGEAVELLDDAISAAKARLESGQ